MTRILVTGSRYWRDTEAIRIALAEVWHPDAVLVNGYAKGADTLAYSCWRGWGGQTEAYPADWHGPCRAECQPGHRRPSSAARSICPAAGNYRNQRMVDLGADLCLAFPLPDSRGTRDCIRRAEAAGIPVRVITPEESR